MGQKIGHRQFSREFKRNALQLVFFAFVTILTFHDCRYYEWELKLVDGATL
jgi:hypothetical protein